LLRSSQDVYKPDLIDVLFLGFYCINLTGIFWAINKADLFYESQKLLPIYVFYVLLKHLLRESKQQVVQWLTLSALGISILGIVATAFSILSIHRELGFDQNTVYLVNVISGHKNLLASYLFLLLPLLFIGERIFKGWKKRIFQLVLLLQLLVIFLLMTRAVYLAVAVAILFFVLLILFKPKFKSVLPAKTIVYSAITAVVLVAAALVASGKLGGIMGKLNLSNSANERLLLWKKSLSMIQDNWLLGVGNGNWKIHLPSYNLSGLYRAEEFDFVFLRPHNDYLAVWSQTGTIGFLLFLGILGFTASSGLKALRGKGPQLIIPSIALAGFLGYLTIAFFDFPMERIEHQVMLVVLMALLTCDASLPQQSWVKHVNIMNGKGLWLIVALLGFNWWIGGNRYVGETHLRAMIGSKESGDYQRLKKESIAARSLFYTAEHSLPIKWYEGIADYHLQDQESAFANFSQAAEENPWNYNVLNNLGAVNFQRAQYSEAIIYYSRALAINPKMNEARLNNAAAHIRMGQLEAAKRLLDSVPGDSPQKQKLLNIIGNRTPQ